LILSYIFKLHQKEELELNNNKLYIVSDSLGLVFFSILGANLALNAHYNFFGIILISLLTATGGGIIRDISLNKVPTIFKEDFYGSISIILGILIYLETYFNIYTVYITYLNISVGLIIRFIALKYKIKVPQIK
jgi:uncharacterized membrane protein YeiH